MRTGVAPAVREDDPGDGGEGRPADEPEQDQANDGRSLPGKGGRAAKVQAMLITHAAKPTGRSMQPAIEPNDPRERQSAVADGDQHADRDQGQSRQPVMEVRRRLPAQ
jgi:hypothetical protein